MDHPGHGAGGAGGPLGTGQCLAGAGEEGAAGRGEVGAAWGALQQRGADRALQALELLGEGGLGDEQAGRGVGDGAGLDDGQQIPAPPTKGPLNGLATLALAYGAISIVGAFAPPVRDITGTTPIPALILGATGWANAHRMNGAGRKQAVAGLVTGLTGLVLTLITR
nr:hypothetical protein [Streptomyces hiroshimensis]